MLKPNQHSHFVKAVLKGGTILTQLFSVQTLRSYPAMFAKNCIQNLQLYKAVLNGRTILALTVHSSSSAVVLSCKVLRSLTALWFKCRIKIIFFVET